MRDLTKLLLTIDNIPFSKREPYYPESEYRIIAHDKNPQQSSYEIDIDLGIIRKITLSSKIPNTIYESLKITLQQINPKLNAKIYHSTLYNNETWKNHFNNT